MSNRCVQVAGGGSIGASGVRLDVASLGPHANVDALFPTTDIAGHITDHRPAADCPPLVP